MNAHAQTDTVIVTPDYQGKALSRKPDGTFADSFTRALLHDSAQGQERVWLVGINGMPLVDMQRMAEETRGRIGALFIDPLACEGKGIIPTLDACYERVVQQYPTAKRIVRKDGREHSASAVRRLEEMVPSPYDHVGVSLTYEEGMLGPNDRQGDKDLRALVLQELGFELSHAHGMQGIAMKHMPETHALMLRIKKMMHQRYGIELAWGYDLLLRLVSIMSGRTFTEIEVPAEVPREDRPTEKIKQQIKNWGQVIDQGKKLFQEARESLITEGIITA